MRKTKIICTLGPASSSDDIVKQLMLSGMDVARFNFSHSTHAEHKKRFDQISRIRKELSLPVATLLDTKGPEIRLGLLEEGKAMLTAGETVTFTTRDIKGTKELLPVSYKNMPDDVKKGTRILIDDGLIETVVQEIKGTEIICKVVNGGAISDRKGINLPGVVLSMPYISEQDRADIIFGAETGFDFIAASFVRTAADVEAVREILSHTSNHNIRIISKIENAQGVENIDEILRMSDGVMVARGDMGVEIPFRELPVIQKMIIKKANAAGKLVITATQMLDSMMKNPRPTRAEASDVANAIYDGTSAIMLSGETAAGAYPAESVKTMAAIAECTEKDIDYKKRFFERGLNEMPSVTNAISHATVTTAIDLKAKAVFALTKTGSTARMLSKYRPPCTIIGSATSERVCRQLNLEWGVVPMLLDEFTDNDLLISNAVSDAVQKRLIKDGDLVVITAGLPLGVSGTTNMMKVHVAGDILITGTGITTNKANARLCVCQSEIEAKKKFKPGDILVISKTSNDIFDLLKECAGIITEQDGVNSHAAIVGLALNKPVLVGAKNATSLLKNGMTVRMDAERGIVCSDPTPQSGKQ